MLKLAREGLAFNMGLKDGTMKLSLNILSNNIGIEVIVRYLWKMFSF